MYPPDHARPSPDRLLRGVWALVLYVACALLLPALHLSFHDRPHDHLPHGLRLHPLGAAHLQEVDSGADHGATEHRHDLDAAVRAASDGPALSAPHPHPASRAAHGLGSLAHFAAGYLASKSCTGLPATSFLLSLALPAPATSPDRAHPTSVHSPRGPPVFGS